MSISRRMDKKAVVQWNITQPLKRIHLNGIHTMEYYSAIKKNTFESVLMRWMKLEPIITE